MQTWKLSIKPDSEVPHQDVLEKCKQIAQSLIGVGWHHAFVDNHPNNLEEAKNLVRDYWKSYPSQLKSFIEEMKAGDHVWVHQDGKFYLCKVKDDQVLYGRDIDPNYIRYDLGHAKKACWVEVPEKFVSGRIQRGVIAQRAIQRIHISSEEARVNEHIFDKLREDFNWYPEIDEEKLNRLLSDVTNSELFSFMTSDEVEDVVAAYLQTRGWIIIKSTCFRSKPKFEFTMLDRHRRLAHVQVKSGQYSLSPRDYEENFYIDKNNLIFLFSTKTENPYPGESIDNVCTIGQDTLCKWMKENLWAVTLPLKVRLWIRETGA